MNRLFAYLRSWFGWSSAELETIDDKLDFLISLVEKIMPALDDLEAKVAAQSTVQASAVTLLTELNTELKAALTSNDTARLQALSAKIDSDTQALAAAVAANTPGGGTVVGA